MASLARPHAVRCFCKSKVAPLSRSANAGKAYKPRNEKQRKYIELLELDRPYIVIGHGAAGSGKTKLAVEVGVEMLTSRKIERLIITRPAVAVDEEQHGFLPGTLDQKMMPWMMPIMDVLGSRFDPLQIDTMMKSRVLEIAPLAFMRGRTFENSYIICDEAQNTTDSQMLMMLTRIGNGSKLVITGDPQQHDRIENSGLIKLLDRLHRSLSYSDNIKTIEFDETDVERHPIIPYILNLYK